MSAELRVLWATVVLTALLTGLASWLAQRRPTRAPIAPRDDTTETAPWLTWSTPPTTSRDVSMSVDASTSSDAGASTEGPSTEAPSTEARDRLGALLAAAFCTRREECLCGAYPSPYAEGHETATTCEADVLRDVHREWEEQVTTAVVLVDDEALHAAIDHAILCSGMTTQLHHFVRQDAVDGEPCEGRELCRDGSRCRSSDCDEEGHCVSQCVADSRVGEACTVGGLDDRRCADGLRCLHSRCEGPLPEGAPCAGETGFCSGTCIEDVCVPEQELVLCGTDDDCPALHACMGGLCEEAGPLQPRCERVALRRFVGQYSESDRNPATECIPVGTPCRYETDCGMGRCEGPSVARCGEPGPHAPSPDIAPPPDTVLLSQLGTVPDDSDLARCAPGDACLWSECVCPADERCRIHDDGTSSCMPPRGRGEPCRIEECTEGLICQDEVPEGGRCVARICMQTRFILH